jgi:hypothetical protein
MSATTAAQRLPLLPAVAYSLLTLIVVTVGAYAFWYRAYYNIWPGQDATVRVTGPCRHSGALIRPKGQAPR